MNRYERNDLPACDLFQQLLQVGGQAVQVTPTQRIQRGVLTAMAKAQGISRSAMWDRVHHDRIDWARKAELAKAWRETKMRPMWRAYCKAHLVKFPQAEPMGFGRFLSEKWYRQWQDDPQGLLAAPNRRSSQAARGAL